MLCEVINDVCLEENIPVINHKLHFNNYVNSNFLSNLTWSYARDNSDDMQNSPSLSIWPQNSLDISESFNIFENDLNNIKTQCLKHFNILIDDHFNKFEMVAQTSANFNIF